VLGVLCGFDDITAIRSEHIEIQMMIVLNGCGSCRVRISDHFSLSKCGLEEEKSVTKESLQRSQLTVVDQHDCENDAKAVTLPKFLWFQVEKVNLNEIYFKDKP
jgi:hypothetical protein